MAVSENVSVLTDDDAGTLAVKAGRTFSFRSVIFFLLLLFALTFELFPELGREHLPKRIVAIEVELVVVGLMSDFDDDNRRRDLLDEFNVPLIELPSNFTCGAGLFRSLRMTSGNKKCEAKRGLKRSKTHKSFHGLKDK